MAELIKSQIILKHKGLTRKSVFSYVSKYVLENDAIAEMHSDGAKIIKSLGVDVLLFNPNEKKFGFIYLDVTMSRSKVPDLRAAI